MSHKQSTKGIAGFELLYARARFVQVIAALVLLRKQPKLDSYGTPGTNNMRGNLSERQRLRARKAGHDAPS